MLLPLLAELKGLAGVTVAARRPGLDILRSQGLECVDVEGGGRHALFQESPEGAFVTAGPEPRHVIAFLGDPGGRVGRNLEVLFPKAKNRVFPGRPGRGAGVHAALYLARCGAEAGLPVDPDRCMSRAKEQPLLTAGVKKGRSGVVLHPGSGGPGKNLPPEFWLALSERLSPQAGVTMLLGPAEESLCPWFEQRLAGKEVSAVFSPEPDALLALLGKAAFYAGHDSGVSHLAAMLGTPTLAVFKAGDPRMWGPLGPRVRILTAEEEGGGLLEAAGRTAESMLDDFAKSQNISPSRKDRKVK